MIRLSMYVMLSTWKQLVKHASKKKKPPVVLSGYSKNQDLTMFSFGLEGFFRILNSVSFGSGRSFSNFWTVLFGFGFRTQPLVSLRIWIVFQTWISDSTFGFSSDWIGFFIGLDISKV